jgi:hypothetical protein
MICVFPFQTSVGTIRRVRISVPLIECLIDGVRYFRPDDLPPASGEELRPVQRPRITVRAARPAIQPRTGNVVRLAVTAYNPVRRG